MRQRDSEFERVVLPHARVLLRFALRLTRSQPAAEDLVQECLMLAWRAFRQLEEETKARAWLFTILMNAYRADLRAMRHAPAAMELTLVTSAAADSDTEKLEVTQALDRLSPDHRTVLLLTAVEGFTCREIAGILDLPIGTVMSRLSRAREAMRELLASKERVER